LTSTGFAFHVDIDKPFENFKKTYDFEDVKASIIAFLPKIYMACMRPSPSGRVHLRIILNKPEAFFTTLQYRAILGDDPYRIRQDLARFHQMGVAYTDRIFDEKFIDGELRTAGKWERFL
jgi:hypothetical protein